MMLFDPLSVDRTDIFYFLVAHQEIDSKIFN
jgi:hypothetical protein